RLEAMLDASQSNENDDGSIADILEDNIEELRNRIAQESKKSGGDGITIEPQTMKEWQMYRAIATRLAMEQETASFDGDDANILNKEDDDANVDEALVARQLDSWREYIEKEDVIRKRSGLASGPKMPFDNLGEKADRWQARQDALSSMPKSTKTRRELRRDVNIQAVQAMEDLILKSDSARAEGLKKELEALKAELEPRDYNDIEVEVAEEPANVSPVDLSDVFSREEDMSNDADTSPTVGLSEDELEGVNRALSSSGGVEDLYVAPSSSTWDEPVQQSPPNTPFFDSYEGEEKSPPPDTPFFSESYEDEKKPPPPPNSPFFQEGRGSARDDVDVENKLGSVDEQKLQAMYRRAGARTKSEQDAIREEWEAFQEFEKQRRDASGLSATADGDESTLKDDANLKYDISDVMKEGGDFDAEKILSTIGPRPTRKPKSSSASASRDAAADEFKSNIGPSDVADSVFRSVSAAGGGRSKDDAELQERQRSEFDEYLAKENEMRNDLDRLDEDAARVAKKMDAPH
ncbi:MAG: hypothetical protein SGILL_006600, partial [Bacillariaceae sp.]